MSTALPTTNGPGEDAPRARARPRHASTERGHVLVLFAVSLVAILLTTALVVDGGIIYGERAQLSKAADAAALAGISNLSLGQGTATQLARDMFDANYRPGPAGTADTSVEVTFTTGSGGAPAIEVRTQATIHPVFLQIIPGMSEIQVHSVAQAQRAKLGLSLVLDRSGSMQTNQGCLALPPAVDTFIGYFDDSIDHASLTTYASNARVDVPLSQPFKAAIRDAVPRECATEYGGYTFFDGGLALAATQYPTSGSPTGGAFVKVIVIFTDGLANTFQDTFSCPQTRTFNVSSGDGGNTVHLLEPSTGAGVCSSNPSNGGPLPCCSALTSFPAVFGGVRYATGPLAGAHVRLEARDRALDRARALRAGGAVIYTIGLGSNVDQDFLRRVANDPAGPQFDPSQPAGAFAHAPTAAQLQGVFETIAKKILVRISL